jgi:membrane peptidoglycan carboxypeptidase
MWLSVSASVSLRPVLLNTKSSPLRSSAAFAVFQYGMTLIPVNSSAIRAVGYVGYTLAAQANKATKPAIPPGKSTTTWTRC